MLSRASVGKGANGRMLKREENELLTRTGPGTPAGELLRRYWQPVALSEELRADGAPLPLKILGEELVLFRDGEGRPGLLGLHCSHRGADLSYGRVENGGLRCIYHGWLYDIHGRCLDQPGEPGGGEHKDAIRHLAYSCQEKAGLIFAYMGPAEPPLLPAYEFLTAPEDHVLANKVFSECSYLQGNEGNLDPVHLSYLHKFFKEGERVGQNTRVVTGSDRTSNAYFVYDMRPTIEVEETDFGLRIFSIRNAEDGKRYVRISNFVYPNWAPNPQGVDGFNVNWHVPINDYSHWKFRVAYSRSKPLDKERLQQQFFEHVGPEWVTFRNRSNRYLQDRNEMETKSFIGMGTFFPVHDLYATENQGVIQDRTTERLGYTDKAIAAHRRLLLRAIRQMQEGRKPPHVIRDPSLNHFEHLVCLDEVIGPEEDWRTCWHKHMKAALSR